MTSVNINENYFILEIILQRDCGNINEKTSFTNEGNQWDIFNHYSDGSINIVKTTRK